MSMNIQLSYRELPPAEANWDVRAMSESLKLSTTVAVHAITPASVKSSQECSGASCPDVPRAALDPAIEACSLKAASIAERSLHKSIDTALSSKGIMSRFFNWLHKK